VIVLKDFKISSFIDDFTREMEDPVNMSQILLKQKILVVNKTSNIIDCWRDVKSRSMELSKNKLLIHVVIREVNNKWIIRAFTSSLNILGLILEDNEKNLVLKGSEAYQYILSNLYVENQIVKYTIGSISIDELPEQLRNIAVKTLEAGASAAPPHVWLNKYLYDFNVKSLISEKGAYMYVFLGVDKFDRKYALKIPREKTIDNKPLAVNSDPSSLLEVFKGYLNVLEILFMTYNDIRIGLSSLEYDESLAEQLYRYKKYILKPRGIIILHDHYTLDIYKSLPPIVIEEYAELGDLSTKLQNRRLEEREAVFLSIRLSGALALTHTAHLIHMDVKPQNILIASDDSEPYGYTPLLADYVGSPHVFRDYIELKKSTPEYADPLSLVVGKASYMYDTYSLGILLFYAITGRRLRGRILFNFLVLQELYNMVSPVKAFIVENPDLANHMNKILSILKDYKLKKISYSELINVSMDYIEEIDKEPFSELKKLVNPDFAEVISKSISLDLSKRYKDAVAMWLDILKFTESYGYRNLIPS